MLTAYDYPTARLFDEAGIDALLVGDSLGMVVLGYPDTTHVTLEQMIHHVAAVARAKPRALVIGDLSIGTYPDPVTALANSRKLVEAGAEAVKLEGGLRQAAIARWPGKVPAGRVAQEPWAFWDFLPTAAELAGAKLPDGFRPDGLSLAGFLRGGAAPARESFYWELHEGATLQAARWGDWKAVRNGPKKAVEVYDLAKDPGERADLARERPELVAMAEAIFKASRTEHPDWPLRSPQQGKQKSPGKN